MPRWNQQEEDEAYARALQDEYRKDFIRRQTERNTVENENENEIGTNNNTNTNTNNTNNTNTTSNTTEASTTRNRSRNRSRNRNRTTPLNTDDNININDNINGNRRRTKKSGKGGKGGKKKGASKSGRSRSRDSTDSATSTREPRRRRRTRSGAAEEPATTTTVVPLPPPYFVNHHHHDDDDDNDEDRVGPAAPSPMDRDEEYARRVQADFCREDDAARRETQNGHHPTTTDNNHHHELSLFSSSSFKDNYSSGSTEPSTDDDEAVAMRIQQELADAEYAQRIGNLEREEAATMDAVRSLDRQHQLEQQQRQEEQQQEHQRRHPQEQQLQRPKQSIWIRWVIPLMFLAIAITVGLLYLIGIFSPSDIPYFGDFFGDDWGKNYRDHDSSNMTFDIINGTSVPRLPDDAFGWNKGGNGYGLKLDIVNACNEEWQPIVEQAIANWDNGSPVDVLTLVMDRVPYDVNCRTATGRLKICNGDYGNTQWRGLNEVLLSPRQSTIVASTAKLNEHYLSRESDAQKLYTCCHELGHGFGLPHWDEDFFNQDLGNCMDYTSNPRNSQEPSDSNFLYLAQLYGGRDINTNQEFTAEDAIAMAYEQRTQEAPLGVRRLFGNSDNNSDSNSKSGVSGFLRNTSNTNNSNNRRSIPLSESRLLNLDPNPDDTLLGASTTATRRILHADENAEIHVFESTEFPGHIVMQQALFARAR